MPFNIGLPEMIIVMVVALIVLGPKRLPDAGRSLGAGLKNFKDSISGSDRDEDRDLLPPEQDDVPAAAPVAAASR